LRGAPLLRAMTHSSSSASALEERIRTLEDELSKLKERVRMLELRVAQSPEHPVDQQMVRSKVAFDWQT